MGHVASAESGVGGVSNSEDEIAEEAIAAISRYGGGIGVQLGDGQVEAVIGWVRCRAHALRGWRREERCSRCRWRGCWRPSAAMVNVVMRLQAE